MFKVSRTELAKNCAMTPKTCPKTSKIAPTGLFSPRPDQALSSPCSKSYSTSFGEALAFFVLFAVLVQDLWVGGLGSSNGRALSFIDSFNNCYSFRNQLPFSPVREKNPRILEVRKDKVYHIGSSGHSIKWRARTLVMSFLLKYGSSTTVSLLLRTTPVFLKGPRHVTTFLVAIVAVQFFPRDIPYRFVHQSPWLQLGIALSISFYKLRKLIYVVKVFSASNRSLMGSLPPLLCLAVIALDGNALARRLENVLSHRGVKTSNWKQFGKEILRAARFFWVRNIGLLVASIALHLTSSVCLTVQRHTVAGVLFEGFVCNLHYAAQIAALLIFMERARIWKARTGQSLLWQVTSGKALRVPWIDQWI
mmetsp:Transcript_27479/g.55290  ORF Transcript_27479/g.55290 Transcript_27479/m.55290 type:complete len:364 (-) Transcript_27479:152-1243(-)